MVDLLVDYFQRVRLSSLTSLEQMYLLALADTLANVSNDSLSNQTYSVEKPTSKRIMPLPFILSFALSQSRYNG